MIDSHCHIAGAEFAGDLDDVIARARGAGVTSALVVLAAGDAAEEAQAGLVEARWPEVRWAVGVHPHQAHEFADDATRAASIVRAQFARMPAARAIGEIGLDYHYDLSPRDAQHAVFRAQLRLAIDLDRPVVIHTREAEDDTIALLREEGQGRLRGVLHCFTGTVNLARAALDLGFYISFAGIVTFPRAGELRNTARLVPRDRLLTETDSPYLAPVPFRGKRNEPAHVGRVVEALAELHGVTPAALGEETAGNFRTLMRP